jgi:hypothetical protein
MSPGNANLPIGGLCRANREIGVPGFQLTRVCWSVLNYRTLTQRACIPRAFAYRLKIPLLNFLIQDLGSFQGN